VNLPPNSSFSNSNRLLQVAMDSTSLGCFKECARKYFYSIILGLQPLGEDLHLKFGTLVHSGVEAYYHARAKGLDHEHSLEACIHQTMVATWEKKTGRPWIPVHKDASYKNRWTLVRMLVWYLDKYGANDPIETIEIDGKAAVEIPFRFDTGFVTGSTNEPVLLCGYLDRIGRRHELLYIPDIKTTKYQLGSYYFKQFNPHNQFTIYTIAGRVAFALPVRGVICDAAQVLVGSNNFERMEIERDEDQLNEFMDMLHEWLFVLETSAQRGLELIGESQDVMLAERAYPMNETSCGNYGGCEFRETCSRTPRARREFLKSNFKSRMWDPLSGQRGDV
jgi:hypothetical protein